MVLDESIAKLYLNHLKSVAIVVLVAVSVFQLSACMERYGWFHMDTEVSRSFQVGVVLKGYQYYYSGRDTMPYAIAGIEKGYSISSPYWISFDPEQDELKKMSDNIFGSAHRRADGAYILDPEGRAIGIWYSNVRHRSVAVDTENHTVTLLFDNPENTRNSR